ncbi:MAG: hypothetical protein KAU01_07740 [Candidatus Cloacimonetes bacterium]|nr:hypothetical protein [Candidatus Cloacimonadota bacterium]
MGYVFLDQKDLDFTLKQVRNLKEYQAINYDDKFIENNLDNINQILINCSKKIESLDFAPIQLESTISNTKLLPEKNAANEYILKNTKGKELIIPLHLSKYLEYNICLISDKNGNYPLNMWDILYNLFYTIIEFMMKKKKNLYLQISDILRNADSIYSNLRSDIVNLQDKYDDKMFDFIFMLPDYFVYVCRLLSDRDVPKEWKIEFVLSIIYLVSPIDFIPEAIIHHPIAYADDAFICLHVLRRSIEGGFISRDNFIKHWPGRPSAIDNLSEWYNALINVLDVDYLRNIFYHLTQKVRKSRV